MLASRAADVAAVQAARDDALVPGFDAELRRQLRRAGADADGAASSTQPPLMGPFTFKRFEAWQRLGLAPPPDEALKLLHRLAADPGVAGVMARHRWGVGALTEMPPEGKVGVSPVCILGVNINQGQEISLRLRTDDLKGEELVGWGEGRAGWRGACMLGRGGPAWQFLPLQSLCIVSALLPPLPPRRFPAIRPHPRDAAARAGAHGEGGARRRLQGAQLAGEALSSPGRSCLSLSQMFCC